MRGEESTLVSDIERAGGLARKIAEDYVYARLHLHQLLPVITVKDRLSATAYLSHA